MRSERVTAVDLVDKEYTRHYRHVGNEVVRVTFVGQLLEEIGELFFRRLPVLAIKAFYWLTSMVQ